MSVEAAPRALIWRNDNSSSDSGRKVYRLRNVSTIHSVRKTKLTTKEQDDSKAEAKSPTEPESAVPPAAQPVPLPAEPLLEQPTAATQPRRKQRQMSIEPRREVFYEFYQDRDSKMNTSQPRNLAQSMQTLKKGIRLATRIGIHEVTSSEGYLLDQQSRSF